MRSIKIITILLIVIAALVFAIQNIASIDVRFLVWQRSVPSLVLIGILLAAGFVIGVLFTSLLRRRARRNG